MSIYRTILSRPRRSHDAGSARQPGRHAPIVTVLLVVSACTAVAADGLPRDDDDRVEARAGEMAWATADDTGDAAAPVVSLAPRPPSSTTTTTVPPIRTGGDLEAEPTPSQVDGRGTIVAHATVADVVARHRPAVEAEPITSFANPTDRGGPLVFQAIGEPEDGWLEVLLPVRPNGTTGWIDIDDVTLTRNPYRIEVDLERYELTVSRLGEVEISAPVAVGQGGTPTPIGDFYLVELLQPPQPNGPYGSYAYGLSGYSDVLDNFNGGEGVIGIHGTNRPDLLGGPASHGCIRLHNDTIELMAGFLPLGTPVSILEADRET